MSEYRRVLSTPGAVAFSSSAVVARLPLSMTALGIVLLVAEQSGSYGRAGLVSASYILAAAAFAPAQGRLVDRVGQAPVLWAGGAAYAVGMTFTIVAIHQGWAVPWPHLCAAAAGLVTPQTGNLVRTRWAHALPDRSLLSTAFAIEAVLDEVVFIVGPILVTVLTLHVADVAGLTAATAAAVLGSWCLALQRRTEPPTIAHDGTSRAPMGWHVVGPLVVVTLGIGVLFGSTEVIVVAFCDEKDATSATGLVLAAWAAGSLLAGLVVGALPGSADSLRRFRWCLLGLGLLFAPLPALPNVATLAVGIFLAGAAISPTLIEAMRLVELNVPAQRLTEGLAWTTLGLAVGVAPGAAVAGRVIDAEGASTAFLIPLVAGLVAAAISWTIRPTTPRSANHSDPPARSVVLGPTNH